MYEVTEICAVWQRRMVYLRRLQYTKVQKNNINSHAQDVVLQLYNVILYLTLTSLLIQNWYLNMALRRSFNPSIVYSEETFDW